jgi:DNA-binding response OmpR family regulator
MEAGKLLQCPVAKPDRKNRKIDVRAMTVHPDRKYLPGYPRVPQGGRCMLKILVIDDERPTLAMFRLFLSAYGYEVHTAENGEQGLSLFRDKRPDIVFTDLKMPGIDGLEVLGRIKDSAIACQVIVITGHGDMEKAIQALDLDAADFINKPVERAALEAALLRAEKRMDYGMTTAMELSSSFGAKTLDIRLKGPVNENSMEAFTALMKSPRAAGVRVVNLCFDDNFSINRQGITVLMTFLSFFKELGADILLRGLSFNFRNIFRMVGLHRTADFETDTGASG